MPYAANNKISQTPFDGCIAITQAQYLEALAGIQVGKVVSIEGGFSVADPAPTEPEEPTPPTQQDRIATLQAIYEVDRNRLNAAWLSAMIADGAEESARKSAIQSQMSALDNQLEADIQAILMEV